MSRRKTTHEKKKYITICITERICNKWMWCVQVVFSLVHLTVWYCFHLPQLFSTFCAQQCILFFSLHSCTSTDPKGENFSEIHIFTVMHVWNVEEVNFSYVITHAYFECSNIWRDGEIGSERARDEWYRKQVNERVSDDSKIVWNKERMRVCMRIKRTFHLDIWHFMNTPTHTHIAAVKRFHS